MGGFEKLGLLGLFLGNLLAATVGNWLGSMITFGIGWLGKTEWIEKWFHAKPETVEKQKRMVSKYGPFLGIICWVPIIGDVIAIALGFYKAGPLRSAFWILIGKLGRFIIWTLLLT